MSLDSVVACLRDCLMENLEGEDVFDGLNVESIQRQRCGFGVDLHVVDNKGEWCVE